MLHVPIPRLSSAQPAQRDRFKAIVFGLTKLPEITIRKALKLRVRFAQLKGSRISKPCQETEDLFRRFYFYASPVKNRISREDPRRYTITPRATALPELPGNSTGTGKNTYVGDFDGRRENSDSGKTCQSSSTSFAIELRRRVGDIWRL